MAHTHKAPGKAHRTGMTLDQLYTMFPDESAARDWFEQVRWAGYRACPRCGNMDTTKPKNGGPLPYHCSPCRRYFSVKTGTVMQSSKLPIRTWVIVMYLMSTSLKGVSSMKLHRDMRITQKTAWMMAQKIREGWTAGTKRFGGPVEVDETFVGGKERNKHADKKLHAGRGAVGKIAVMGVKDRATKRVQAAVVASTDADTLKGFVADTTTPDTTVYTDGESGYVGLPRHEFVRHSVGEYVRGFGAHQRHRELLVDAQARVLRDVPQDEPEAPRPLRDRILRTAQCPPARHDYADVAFGGWPRWEVAPLGGVDRWPAGGRAAPKTV